MEESKPYSCVIHKAEYINDFLMVLTVPLNPLHDLSAMQVLISRIRFLRGCNIKVCLCQKCGRRIRSHGVHLQKDKHMFHSHWFSLLSGHTEHNWDVCKCIRWLKITLKDNFVCAFNKEMKEICLGDGAQSNQSCKIKDSQTSEENILRLGDKQPHRDQIQGIPLAQTVLIWTDTPSRCPKALERKSEVHSIRCGWLEKQELNNVFKQSTVWFLKFLRCKHD